MQQLIIQTTDKKQVVNITDKISEHVSKSGIESGICHVFVLHTTCCLTTADLDPGTDEDYLKAIAKMFPEGNYKHPHNPDHVGDHIMSSLIGNSVSVPIKDGKILTGTWQDIVLIELDGPRERNLAIYCHN